MALWDPLVRSCHSAPSGIHAGKGLPEGHLSTEADLVGVPQVPPTGHPNAGKWLHVSSPWFPLWWVVLGWTVLVPPRRRKEGGRRNVRRCFPQCLAQGEDPGMALVSLIHKGGGGILGVHVMRKRRQTRQEGSGTP